MSKFVKLDEELLASDAWAFLKPGPRVLYVELKRKFTGSNNGSIFMSQRDAAIALNVTKDTVTGYFKALEKVGLIQVTNEGKIGPSGIGTSPTWQIMELPMIEVREPKQRRTFNKSAPPKYTPKLPSDDDVIDDLVF
jgi:DNA-binding transcriptional MocR family regulator